MIKGITVTLVDRVKTGEDEMGAATYDDVEIQVENVLVSPTEATDVINQVQLYGKKQCIRSVFLKAIRITGKIGKLNSLEKRSELSDQSLKESNSWYQLTGTRK